MVPITKSSIPMSLIQAGMSSLSSKMLAATLIAVFASASPALAEKAHEQKHKQTADASAATRGKSQYWGTNVFPAGPLYFGGVYLGDDPDPNIRFQLYRDISGRFGGSM